MAQGSRSRSASSSPAPAAAAPVNLSGSTSGPSQSSASSFLVTGPQRSNISAPSTDHAPSNLNVPEMKRRKPTAKSSFSQPPAPKVNTAPRSKSMTSSSIIGSFQPEQPQQRQPEKPQPQKLQQQQKLHQPLQGSPLKPDEVPVLSAKPSFGQKLKKAFTFGKKSGELKPEKSERSFSFSFAKKTRASTMGASILQPTFKSSKKKKSERAMTMSNMDHFTDSNNNRTSTMTSHAPPPTFEGFDSNFVDVPKRRKPSRSRLADDDAGSIHSNSSISSFATLKKMGTSFSKGTKSLFNKNSSTFKGNSTTPNFSPYEDPTRRSVSSSSIMQSKPVETSTRSHSFSVATSTPVAPFFAEGERTQSLSLASNLSNYPSSVVPGITSTPTRTDADSVSTDVASTIKVTNNSPDDTLALTASEDESEEDLNVADTVFPKKLDSLTVESIRSSLDRTKSLERRRSRRSNKSSRSAKSGDSEKRAPNSLEIHISPEDAPLSIPPSPGSSPHGILKQPSPPDENEPLLLEPPTSLVPATRNRNSMKPSPSMNSIFDFGDSDINLDLNFDFAPAAAAGLETEAKKYKSSLKSKPKNYSLSESQMQQSYEQGNPDYSHTKTPSKSYYHPLYQPSRPNTLHSGHRTNSSTSSAHSVSNLIGSVSFSPRIIIYDTYDPDEYDRRAEIATCNRLNPMLAQQIKEELNNFKMEMDVHVESRIYTHFY